MFQHSPFPLLCVRFVVAFLYPVNKYKHYITNSPTASGIVFFYVNPADTLKHALYIPDFKETDIKDFQTSKLFTMLKFAFPITIASLEVLFFQSLQKGSCFTSTTTA